MTFWRTLLLALVAAHLAGCATLYKLNHVDPTDRTDKDWTRATEPRNPPPK